MPSSRALSALSFCFFLVLTSWAGAENFARGAILSTGRGAGDLAPLTDEIFLPEGAAYNTAGTWQIPKDDYIEIDLLEARPIASIVLQGDHNDVYMLFGSHNKEEWEHLASIEKVVPRGLRSRLKNFSTPQNFRYLRIRPGDGDGLSGLSEIQIRDQIGELRSTLSEEQIAFDSNWLQYFAADGLTQGRIDQLKEMLAVIGLVLAGMIFAFRAARGRPPRWLLFCLYLVGFCSIIGWWNFFRFHLPNHTHVWDAYHYYVGSKYFPELGYSGIYACTLQADKEAEVPTALQGRKIRDLATNKIISSANVDSESCKQQFSPERWQLFTRDVAWFRMHMDPFRWGESQIDHGYNPTPAWTLAGYTLSNLYEANDRSIFWLSTIDAWMLLGMWLAVFLVFGPEAGSMAAIFWGTNFAARYWWTGGSFLRSDWLVYLVLGLCALRSGRQVLGGALLALSSSLRVFPSLLFIPLLLNIVLRLVQGRGLSRRNKKFLFGATGAAVVLLILPMLLFGRPDCWTEFLHNTEKHVSTPLTNNVGLKTVISYSSETRAELTKESWEQDPFILWKEYRRQIFDSRFLIYLGIVISVVLAVTRLASREHLWVQACLGLTLIPFLTEMTCYYYGFFLCLALLVERLPSAGILCCLLAYLTCLCPNWWNWYDQVFLAVSLCSLLVCLCIWTALAAAKPLKKLT